MFGKINQFALLSLATMLSVGCNNETAQVESPQTAAVMQQSEDAAPIAEKSRQVAPVAHGKPGAQVSLLEDSLYRLEPGIDGEVVLQLAASYSDGEMSVTLNTSEGLLIVAGSPNYTFALAEGESYPIPLRLLAPNAGRYYVHLQINVNAGGRQTFKALSAIVQVGAETQRSTPQLQKRQDARDVISLPAREEIIQD